MSHSNVGEQSSRYSAWRGLGVWNFYFLAKIGLYFSGYIDFDLFYNLVFAAFILMPLRFTQLKILRIIVAFFAAIALLYYDSWLPPIRRLMEQPEVLNFSNEYLLELLLRFINWNLLGAGLLCFIAYLFLAQWLRMTAFTLVAFVVMAVPSMLRVLPDSLNHATEAIAQPMNISTANPLVAAVRSGDINTVLNEELELFYQAEKTRQTTFTLPVADAAHFDVLLLNICSLAWSDLEVSQLQQHPLFTKMDIMFDQFNSATSYSGPAVLRLMKASCGQPSHDVLYEEKSSSQQCNLFNDLENLGFSSSAALNHTGEFENFIDELGVAGITTPPTIPKNIRPKLKAFDDTPIWGDYDALKVWWDERLETQVPSAALLYNTISLHDGNREATADGGSRVSPYAKRAEKLLDDLDIFMRELEVSGRQVMVVFVPEHGAALEGDRMQISGIREIPTPDITHVPVGVRFIGAKSALPATTIHIGNPTSYLALSELISRVIGRDIFDQEQVDWSLLTSDLPETRAVSENSGTVMINYQGTPYIRLGNKDWVKYAQ